MYAVRLGAQGCAGRYAVCEAAQVGARACGGGGDLPRHSPFPPPPYSVVEYMDRAQGHTVIFSTQNFHLTQSEPGKIDPICTPDRCEEANQSPMNPLKHSPQAVSSSQCLLYELCR